MFVCFFRRRRRKIRSSALGIVLFKGLVGRWGGGD